MYKFVSMEELFFKDAKKHPALVKYKPGRPGLDPRNIMETKNYVRYSDGNIDKKWDINYEQR